MTDEVLIQVKGLKKAFGDFYALNGVDAELHKGEVMVIIGPSGSCLLYTSYDDDFLNSLYKNDGGEG